MAKTHRARREMEDRRDRLRLLIAAAAVFVLLLGLTVLVYMVLWTTVPGGMAIAVFFAFFLTGVLLFLASAFIDTEAAKTVLDAAGMLKGLSGNG